MTILCLTLAVLTATLMPASLVHAGKGGKSDGECDPSPCAIQEPGGN
jgi:hypothetical protein